MKRKLDQLKQKIAGYKYANTSNKHQKVQVKCSFIGFSLEIVAAVAFGFLMGFYLDKWFHFKFLFKITCSLLAFIASFVNIYRMLVKK